MARRADHTRQELAELAIQAGLKRIREEGFARFSIRQVAADIGYTVGTLYNVFGGYDEFVMHINARTLDEWYEVMQKAVRKADKSVLLQRLAKAYVAYSKNHYHQWSALFEHHASEGHEPPEWYHAKMNRFFSLAEAPLLEMQGDSRKARRSARVLWAGIHGICILSLSGKLDLVKADSPESMALDLIDAYLKGLGYEA